MRVLVVDSLTNTTRPSELFEQMPIFKYRNCLIECKLLENINLFKKLQFSEICKHVFGHDANIDMQCNEVISLCKL